MTVSIGTPLAHQRQLTGDSLPVVGQGTAAEQRGRANADEDHGTRLRLTLPHPDRRNRCHVNGIGSKALRYHQSMEIYEVGGAVRDSLLDLPVGERDWVVVGTIRPAHRTSSAEKDIWLRPLRKDWQRTLNR